MDYREFFQRATGKEPFPFQERLAEGEWPRVLRVPTGCGKTEAVLVAWLYRRQSQREQEPRRLVYCLPLRALVFQTVERARRIVERLGLHKEVLVQTLMGGEAEEEWCRFPEREAILVGTMDMLLSRALNRGYGLSRFRYPVDFGLLTNDVMWVFDEVQLMGNGLWTGAQLAGLLRADAAFGPVRTLWCSATVEPEWLKTPEHEPPKEGEVLRLRKEDREHPELRRRLGAKKLVSQLEGKGAAALARKAVDRARAGEGPVLVVVNTVDRAVQVYRKVKEKLGQDRVLLLHSRYRPPDRKRQEERLQEVLGRPDGVVVATQVVEAGLDISARVLITEAAPVTGLVQRLGRCNRNGEWEEGGEVLWALPEGPEPYSQEEVDDGEQFLEELNGRSASPLELDGRDFSPPPEPQHPLRSRDLWDLFDTAPDLVGSEVDVSRFIRDSQDLDVYFFWRDEEPKEERLSPSPQELCSVPFAEARQFLEREWKRRGGRLPAWRFDPLEDRWVPLRPEEVRPGLRVLLGSEVGGYNPDLGFDPEARTRVEPVKEPAREEAEEGTGADPLSFGVGRWVRLEEHAREAREEMRRILQGLGGVVPPGLHRVLKEAAFWHDLGKAHPVFQKTMEEMARQGDPAPQGEGPWAKAPQRLRSRHERPHFRHELASALALIAWEEAGGGPLRELDEPLRSLLLYLVGAHHGRVRTAIRSVPEEAGHVLGIAPGDRIGPLRLEGRCVPELTLDLSPMEMGSPRSWVELAGRLLKEWGPFRLAYLEALVRIADWRVSRAWGS